MKVIITNNEVDLPDGTTKQSTVYHSSELPCGNTPKPDSPHRVEVEEDLAKAFGRHLCGLCRITAERTERVQQLQHTVAGILSGLDLDDLADALPDNIELRVLAHGVNKTPIVIWTTHPKDKP